MSVKSLLGLGLPIGVTAPDFSLVGGDMKTYTLSDYRGKKVFLYFYPQAFTIGCTAQACSFREGYSKMKELGFTLLGISADAPNRLQEFSEKHRLPFPLLSDSTLRVSKDYEVLMPFATKASRVTFLIDPYGQIKDHFRFLPWKNYASSLMENQ